jgi:hypothetical protein
MNRDPSSSVRRRTVVAERLYYKQFGAGASNWSGSAPDHNKVQLSTLLKRIFWCGRVQRSPDLHCSWSGAPNMSERSPAPVRARWFDGSRDQYYAWFGAHVEITFQPIHLQRLYVWLRATNTLDLAHWSHKRYIEQPYIKCSSTYTIKAMQSCIRSTWVKRDLVVVFLSVANSCALDLGFHSRPHSHKL